MKADVMTCRLLFLACSATVGFQICSFIIGRLLSLGCVDGFCQPFECLEVTIEGNISLHIYIYNDTQSVVASSCKGLMRVVSLTFNEKLI